MSVSNLHAWNPATSRWEFVTQAMLGGVSVGALASRGGYFELPTNTGSVGAVSIFGATTGQAFSAWEW